MIIESIIQRAAGTTVTLGATTYRFEPKHSDGPHVADVTNAEHIKILLDNGAFRSLSTNTQPKANSESLRSPIAEPRNVEANAQPKRRGRPPKVVANGDLA